MAIDIDSLRKTAVAKNQILIITFYPTTDSVENESALYDTDELMEVKFVDVAKQ
jgi:hypothetical protein